MVKYHFNTEGTIVTISKIRINWSELTIAGSPLTDVAVTTISNNPPGAVDNKAVCRFNGVKRANKAPQSIENTTITKAAPRK